MSPLLEDEETILYTNAARLIPLLIDDFAIDDEIRLNFLYLDCLPASLLESADQHAMTELNNSTGDHIFWAIKLSDSKIESDGSRSFITKAALSTIQLTPDLVVYSDEKNLITTASAVSVELAPPRICE